MTTPLLLPYQFDSTMIVDPTSHRLTLDAAFPYSAATEIRLNRSTDDSVNVKRLLMAFAVGTTIWLQDMLDATIAHAFVEVGLPIDRDTTVALPVRWISSEGGAFTHLLRLLVAAVPPVAGATVPTEPPPPYDFAHVPMPVALVSLPVAKQHLRITDDAHDTDVLQKLQAAQDQIVAKLSYAADPAWTEATVPRHVAHAILMLTAAFYEVRGGEDRDENFRKTWAAIDQLLMLNRDPTLA